MEVWNSDSNCFELYTCSPGDEVRCTQNRPNAIITDDNEALVSMRHFFREYENEEDPCNTDDYGCLLYTADAADGA